MAQNGTAGFGASVVSVQIFVISDFLNIPGSLFNAHIQPNVSSSMDIFGLAGITDAVNQTHGATFFLPTDDAITSFLAASPPAESAAFENILKNHIINGSTLYTPNFISMGISSTDSISSSGESLGFSTNLSGTYVHSYKSTARIVQPDIILQNGVVYVVDTVLWNEMAAPGPANSAFVSASSAAVGVPTRLRLDRLGLRPARRQLG